MGSCLGHCHPSKESFYFYKYYSKAKENVQVNTLDRNELEEHAPTDLLFFHDKGKQNLSEFNTKKRSLCFCLERLKSVFTKTKNHYADSSSIKLELLENECSIAEEEECAFKKIDDILISPRTNIKTSNRCISESVNSLDLEWEHLPEMIVYSNNVEREEPKSTTSVEVWSKISGSADSLEWDLAEVEMKEELDFETEQLLQEIETLSLKTLQETQEWAS